MKKIEKIFSIVAMVRNFFRRCQFKMRTTLNIEYSLLSVEIIYVPAQNIEYYLLKVEMMFLLAENIDFFRIFFF